MDHSTARPAHESHLFPGHEQRMADHARRVRSAICECGSGLTYGECCMDHDTQRSAAQISYSLPRSVHPDAETRWALEDHLRVQAFATLYRAGSAELDLTARFVRALLASAGPIKQPNLVAKWQEQASRGTKP
jgi:hypothetical protein